MQQVLFHGEAREDLAALRHVAEAGAGALVRLRRVRSLFSKQILPVRSGTRPISVLQQRGLAHAVAAEQRRHLARRHLEARRRAGCGCRRSTGSDPTVNDQGTPRSRADRSSPAPSGLRRCTLPSCSTVTLRAMVSMNAMSCSTTTSECVPASDRKSSAVRSVSWSLMPGDRLVEQQQLRLLHQQHADLEPLLLAVRQQAGDAIGGFLQADERERGRDPVFFLAGSALQKSVARTRLSAFIASSRFSNTREPLEDGGLLELAADAGVRDLGFRQAREVGRLAEHRPALVRAASCR